MRYCQSNQTKPTSSLSELSFKRLLPNWFSNPHKKMVNICCIVFPILLDTYFYKTNFGCPITSKFQRVTFAFVYFYLSAAVLVKREHCISRTLGICLQFQKIFSLKGCLKECDLQRWHTLNLAFLNGLNWPTKFCLNNCHRQTKQATENLNHNFVF